MDQFTVPQFIEQKPKVVGPLTFQQFIYMGIAGAVAFFLYFTAPLPLFILGGALALAVASLLAFGKSSGRPMSLVLKNFFVFTMAPKMYLWKKKTGPPPKLAQAPKIEPEEIKKSPVPAIIGRGHLKEISSQIEIKK